MIARGNLHNSAAPHKKEESKMRRKGWSGGWHARNKPGIDAHSFHLQFGIICHTRTHNWRRERARELQILVMRPVLHIGLATFCYSTI